MTQPGPFLFRQSPHETARLSVRAAVLVQTRQGLEQPIDEVWAELGAGLGDGVAEQERGPCARVPESLHVPGTVARVLAIRRSAR